MATDPTISLQAGRPPSGSEAGGGILQQPNLLSNPSQLNALMTMGGNLAAGRAMQQAITPDGFSPELFAQVIKNDPQAAYAALPAMEKGLAIGKAQLDQAAAQKKNMQTALSGLLLDPKFREDPDYANQQYGKTLVDLTNQGVLSPQRAANEAQMKPTGTDGKLDIPATVQRLEQHFYNTLPQDQQKNLQYGEIVLVPRGDGFLPVRVKPQGGLGFGQFIPKGVPPEILTTPQPTTPTAGGQPQTIPLIGRAQQLGIQTSPPVPGPSTVPNPVGASSGQPAPTASPFQNGGRYPVNPDLAKFLASMAKGDWEGVRTIYQKLSPEDQAKAKAKLQGRVSAQQPQ